jgi:hypothetical protein
MRVGRDWHASAAVHLYKRLELGGRYDPFKIIYGLDRTLCWDLPWEELSRSKSGSRTQSASLAEERSPRKIVRSRWLNI